MRFKRKEQRKHNQERYTIIDFFLDLLLAVPEVLFAAFRVLLLGARHFVRWIIDLF